MILWSEQFETGSAVLDRQHRLLIDNINLLGEHLQNPNPSREETAFARHLVDYLEAYALVHFQGEEKCMDSFRCPAHAENLKEHERFRDFIRNYKRLCELEGFKTELLRDLHTVIRSWIQRHILTIDTRLRPCLPPALKASSDPLPG